MALTITSTPVDGTTQLTSLLWTTEFNNIYNNGLSLVSPLTGNLDLNGNRLLAIAAGSLSAPSLYPTGDTNTGICFTSADVVEVTAGGVRSVRFNTAATGVNYLTVTPAASGANVRLDVDGSDVSIGLILDTKGTGPIVFSTDSTTRGQVSTGALLWGNAAATGVGSKAIVLDNNQSLQWVNAAATTAADISITATSSDHMALKVPDTAGQLFTFNWGSNVRVQLTQENSGAGIVFLGESSGNHTAPAANGCTIYTKDNGGGKTQLMAIFASGAAQQIAIQP